MEYCLNLCDIFTALLREYECVENLISSAERTKKARYGRLYLGSYFCDTYFVQNFIRIDPDIPDYKIEEILKKVELYDDIFSPGKNGLDTSLKKNAVTFSGGQRRRLSLAMIFACAAPIVILDEPFVGIDKRTQERLWVNIKEELRNKTVIIIEHNFSDTQYFQKVFVITGYGNLWKSLNRRLHSLIGSLTSLD